MVKKLTRLPVQHPQAPHCAACDAPLPNFNNTQFVMGMYPTDAFELEAVTFHIQCKCGAKWDIKKKTK